MKITYNTHRDTLRILFCGTPVCQMDRQRSGVTLDYDQHGQIVGLELSMASHYVADPYRIDMEPEPIFVGEAI